MQAYNQEQILRWLQNANKDLDRLVLARELMNRVTSQRRSNSKLPQLVDLSLSRPLVTVPLAAKLLKVTSKVVNLMLAQLGGALPRLGRCVTEGSECLPFTGRVADPGS